MFLRKSVSTIIIMVGLLSTSVLPSQADVLGDAVQQQQELENQKSQTIGQLNKLTYTSDKIKAQLSQLETQVANAQALLAEKQASYTQAQAAVDVAQTELDQKQKELESRQDALGKRAKGIYVNGQLSYFELLFQSADLSDFINRMEYFSQLIANDRQLLSDVKTQKEKIIQKTDELKSKRDQASQLKNQAASASAELDKSKSQQRVALDDNLKAQEEAFADLAKFEAESNALSAKIRAMQASHNGGVSGSISTWPTPGYYEISSPFGPRTHPVSGQAGTHTGVDIPAPTGAEIHATGAGVVLIAGWNTAYGNMVIIDHGNGVSSLYGHMTRSVVAEGQTIQANQIIGYVGSTGWSTGPHLHFEVRVNGNPVNPLQYFP